MRYNPVETLMGGIVLITAICFLILGMKIVNDNQKEGYQISLIFGSSAGLKNGDHVKISGINVGKILNLELNMENYNAKVIVNLNDNIKVPDDSSARIISSSLLGGNFIDIIPGSAETYLKFDDIIYDTKDSVSFTDLLGKAVFSNNKK
jgi:phospholipid/cholesterol/gamma-HCH transport system substrate-binding protein|tara:strand:- start:1021 stop:1467 length:447 start_codon:yes stop_codon:yes gene_type:complete